MDCCRNLDAWSMENEAYDIMTYITASVGIFILNVIPSIEPNRSDPKYEGDGDLDNGGGVGGGGETTLYHCCLISLPDDAAQTALWR